MPSIPRIAPVVGLTLCVVAAAPLFAQAPAPRKRPLVIGEENGYRREAVIPTDTELLYGDNRSLADAPRRHHLPS